MASPVLKEPVKIALIQLATGPDKAANLHNASVHVQAAAAKGARIVVLPECFNSPYGTDFFPSYAETLQPSPPSAAQSPSYHALARMAAAARVFLVGGSIPEFAPATGKYHNTSLVFAPDGALLGAHRKLHLFDVDLPGRVAFRESAVLAPGDALTLLDLAGLGRVAVAVCYDVRFPELAAIAARRGAFLLVYPGAFSLATGALHWRLQARARAMDNQLFVAMCSPARDMAAAYHAWGHSLVVDPWAEVLAEAGEGEETVIVELRPEKIDEVRRNIPLDSQRRFDVYPDVSTAEVTGKAGGGRGGGGVKEGDGEGEKLKEA